MKTYNPPFKPTCYSCHIDYTRKQYRNLCPRCGHRLHWTPAQIEELPVGQRVQAILHKGYRAHMKQMQKWIRQARKELKKRQDEVENQ